MTYEVYSYPERGLTYTRTSAVFAKYLSPEVSNFDKIKNLQWR